MTNGTVLMAHEGDTPENRQRAETEAARINARLHMLGQYGPAPMLECTAVLHDLYNPTWFLAIHPVNVAMETLSLSTLSERQVDMLDDRLVDLYRAWSAGWRSCRNKPYSRRQSRRG